MNEIIKKVKENLLNLVSKNNTIEQDEIFDVFDLYNINEKEEIIDEIFTFLTNKHIQIISYDNNLKIDNDLSYNSNNSLANYLHEISRYSLLKPEEELHLGKIIYQGNKASEEYAKNPAKTELIAIINQGIEARNELVIRNRRLVVSWAKKYSYANISLDDLIGEGNLGLITAASKYNYKKNIKFSTYASYWIRQKISLAIKNNGKTIRIPLSTQKQINAIRKVEQDFIQDKGRKPTYKEISLILGSPYDEDKVKQLLIYASDHVVSLDEVSKTKGSTSEGHDMYDVIDNGEPALMEEKDDKEQKSLISNEALNVVSAKEQDIIKRYFGIGCEKMTLTQIGQLYNGVSKERIRQIKDLAIRKIKRYMKEKS